MSKSSKKLGKLNLLETETKAYSHSAEGALDPNYYVKGQMKNKSWHQAKIIDCRLSKDYDPAKKKTDYSYEYYVHYVDFDRRMDEWVARSRVDLTRKLIEEESHTNKKKRKVEDKKADNNIDDPHDGMDAQSLLAHEQATKFKTIDMIEIGRYRTETWYFSPYPEGYQNLECLFICEFCLSFYITKEELIRHAAKCDLTNPPGDEIYRHDKNSVFEIDGHKNPTYCENLSYLAKLFLDHKTLAYDVEPFLFFVLTENDENGHHLVGYFSKEKESSMGYNLACILTLPFYQRKGYGKFLITLSYELSLKEKKAGTPERPLSDLGRESYVSWWTQKLIDYFKANVDHPFTITDIVKDTCMKETDIIYVLEKHKLINYAQGQYFICTDSKLLDQLYKQSGRPGLGVEVEKLHWIPFKFRYDPTALPG